MEQLSISKSSKPEDTMKENIRPTPNYSLGRFMKIYADPAPKTRIHLPYAAMHGIRAECLRRRKFRGFLDANEIHDPHYIC